MCFVVKRNPYQLAEKVLINRFQSENIQSEFASVWDAFFFFVFIVFSYPFDIGPVLFVSNPRPNPALGFVIAPKGNMTDDGTILCLVLDNPFYYNLHAYSSV